MLDKDDMMIDAWFGFMWDVQKEIMIIMCAF